MVNIPNKSTEEFGCCGFHADCIAQGKCVRSHYWTNYATICSVYKNVVSKMAKKVKKIKKVKS